ncbi:hypothetical protein [Ktedonospora formicarum]|uniref:hypothetical protein n=1 Tax=Ktedonospora formicarum TaxID=2778364 RepID=UPI001C6927F6|nr:hypothetical protein [Ktedonospora formicarum]
MAHSSETSPKGGFLQGLPDVSTRVALPVQQSDCCGITDQATSGCCGEPATQGATASTAIGGCCSEPTSTSMSSGATSGCCGEPTTTSVASKGTGGCCGEPVQASASTSSGGQVRCC